jgi:hypothetical protein
VIGGWRILCNEELQSFHALPNITRLIKSRKMRYAHVARMGNMRNVYKILVGEPERK